MVMGISMSVPKAAQFVLIEKRVLRNGLRIRLVTTHSRFVFLSRLYSTVDTDLVDRLSHGGAILFRAGVEFENADPLHNGVFTFRVQLDCTAVGFHRKRALMMDVCVGVHRFRSRSLGYIMARH